MASTQTTAPPEHRAIDLALEEDTCALLSHLLDMDAPALHRLIDAVQYLDSWAQEAAEIQDAWAASVVGVLQQPGEPQ